MRRTRIGKIARLSQDLRTDLNQMIQDGKPGKAILKWVNSVVIIEDDWEEYEVKVAITKQNLSEWRAGGYQDWLKQQEAMEWVQRLGEEAEELDAATGAGIADRFAAILAVELTRVAKVLLEKETDPEKRWARLCEVSEKLSRIRRDDHRAEQTRALRRKRAEAEKKEEDSVQVEHDEYMKKMRKVELFAPMEMAAMAAAHGGGAAGWTFAARAIELKYDLTEGFLGNLPDTDEGRGARDESRRRKAEGGNQGESEPVQASPTENERGDA